MTQSHFSGNNHFHTPPFLNIPPFTLLSPHCLVSTCCKPALGRVFWGRLTVTKANGILIALVLHLEYPSSYPDKPGLGSFSAPAHMYASMKPPEAPSKPSPLPGGLNVPFSWIILIEAVEIASWRAFALCGVLFTQQAHWPHFTDGETWVTEAAGTQVGNQTKILTLDLGCVSSWGPYILHHDGQTLLFCSLLWPPHLEHSQTMCVHVLCVFLCADLSASLRGLILYKLPSSTLTLLCQAHSRNLQPGQNLTITWTRGLGDQILSSWATTLDSWPLGMSLSMNLGAKGTLISKWALIAFTKMDLVWALPPRVPAGEG